MRIILYIVIFFLSVKLSGQEPIRSTNNNKGFEPRFDFRASGGVAIPLGNYAAFTNESDSRSSAAYGGYVELTTSITPVPTSPWRTSFSIGYLHNNFQVQKSKDFFKIPIFNALDWDAFYATVGICFLSKKKFHYGIGVDVGVMGYLGGVITSSEIVMDTMELRNWNYPLAASLVFKGSALLGYQITESINIYISAAILYAAGVRKGNLQTDYLVMDGQGQPAYPSISTESRPIENQTAFFTLNLGLGFRYKFYKDPEKLNYKFNIDENK